MHTYRHTTPYRHHFKIKLLLSLRIAFIISPGEKKYTCRKKEMHFAHLYRVLLLLAEVLNVSTR